MYVLFLLLVDASSKHGFCSRLLYVRTLSTCFALFSLLLAFFFYESLCLRMPSSASLFVALLSVPEYYDKRVTFWNDVYAFPIGIGVYRFGFLRFCFISLGILCLVFWVFSSENRGGVWNKCLLIDCFVRASRF